MQDLISRKAAIAAIEAEEESTKLSMKGLDIDAQTINRAICLGMEHAVLELSNMPPASEWISAKERLPEEEGNYLCYYRHNGNITIRHCYEGDPEGFAASDFTHWQPLPAPPSE